VKLRERLIPYLLLGVLTLAVGLGLGLGLFEAPVGVGHGLSDRLELTSTHVVAGRQIKGWLVIENGGSSFGLNRRNQCKPGFAVALANKHYQQEIAFDADCESGRFTVAQGITRLPITILTTYETCRPIGTGPITPEMPYRLADGQFPPIPSGRYFAHVVWTDPVQLPKVKAVAVMVLPGG